jgi:large subunit ribosomal protein L25
MEAKKLNAEVRTEKRKAAAGRLRRDGKIPAIVYGHVEPMVISINAREFRSSFKRITENTIIELKLPEGSHEVLVKDYQRDNLTGDILHIDFYEFKKGVALRTRVPLRLTGNPIGVKEGGILEILMHDMEVECLPKDLPEEIVLDVANLALSHSVHVKEVALSEGVRAIPNPEQVVCTVAVRKAEEEAAPAAAAAVEGEVPVEGEEGAEEKKEEGAAEEEQPKGKEKAKEKGKEKEKK